MRAATWKFVPWHMMFKIGRDLSAQWNVEHVHGNDAVKLVGAWDCGLSRKLWFRVCVAVCTTIFTSDTFEHYRFRVSCLQHFQKLSPRWMSQVSMILIHHLDLCLCGTLMFCWLLVLVEPRVFHLLVVVSYCHRHELSWLSSVPMEKRRFQCCHQNFAELSIMLLGSSAASTSSRIILVVLHTPIGTKSVCHR